MYNEDVELKRIFQAEVPRTLQFDMQFDRCIQNVFNKKYSRMRGIKNKIVSIICAIALLLAGAVVAANINNIKTFFRGLGKGVDTAIANGYIATPNKEFVAINDVGASVVIEDFLMDDMNLSASFVFKFDNSLKEKVDLDNVNFIEINDLIIRDEENRIIYSGHDKNAFEEYCKKFNLNYKYQEFNENYMGNGLNIFIETKEDDFLRLICNMNSENFPKSKKLYISFGKIIMLKTEENKETEYNITGEWNVEVDVPESMYNRSKEYYRVVNCDNPDFDVYAASVSDTGFELGIIISNIEKPEIDEEKYNNYFNMRNLYNKGEISEQEYNEKSVWYYNWLKLNEPIIIYKFNFDGVENHNISYIQNSIDKKFEVVFNTDRIDKKVFLNGNKYNFYETFSMTKYDATEKIKVFLYYYDNFVTINLEKINY